ncbi:unnamed protein product [Cochlearia groenlandica]
MAQAHYPPCTLGEFCMDSECCSEGRKYEWPELVGKTGEMAIMTIEKENQYVKALILGEETVRTQDFCCNRVLVLVNSKGNVLSTPMIG